jgi:hypothetical protein
MGAGEARRIEKQLLGCEATRRQRCLLCGNTLRVSPRGVCLTCSAKSTRTPWSYDPPGASEYLAKKYGENES